jgi:hypothetical protein
MKLKYLELLLNLYFIIESNRGGMKGTKNGNISNIIASIEVCPYKSHMNWAAHINLIQTEQVYIKIHKTEEVCPCESHINQARINEGPCNRTSLPT